MSNLENKINYWLSIQSDKVKNNVTIIDNTSGEIVLLRLDKKVPNGFVPRMPISSVDNEDMEVPRICTSRDLLGCLLGVNVIKTINDFTEENKDYLGGYKISIFKPKYIIKPSKELVPSQEKFSEYWIISYGNDEDYEYETIGEVIPNEFLTMTNRTSNKYEGTILVKFKVKFDINKLEKLDINTEDDKGELQLSNEYSDLHIEFDAKTGNGFRLYHSCNVYTSDVKLHNEKKSMTLLNFNLNDKVSKNTVLATPETYDQDFLLHIVKEKAKGNKFLPNISARSNPSEDRTIARIHTSPFLIGCIIGYAGTYWDAVYNNAHSKDSKINGYYIYKIPFTKALKPNNKLVFDATVTDETWLVTYDKETISYTGSIIGELFINNIAINPIFNNTEIVINYLLHVKEKIKISKKVNIESGYYSFSMKTTNKYVESQYGILPKIEYCDDLENVDKGTYDKNKYSKFTLLNLSMLLENKKPLSLKW